MIFNSRNTILHRPFIKWCVKSPCDIMFPTSLSCGLIQFLWRYGADRCPGFIGDCFQADDGEQQGGCRGWNELLEGTSLFVTNFCFLHCVETFMLITL